MWITSNLVGFIAGVGVLCGCLLAGWDASADSPPQVKQIEPPLWWPGHSMNPVRLLIRGKNLTGARVTVGQDAIRPGLCRINPSGTSLFVDVDIAPDAPTGKYPLQIATVAGTTEVAFQLESPLARAGRFQGIGPDDVIYLIMPDRFANGSAENDNPSVSPGLTDRRKSRFYHGGDFAGVIRHLPYLRELGVTALWLNPWYDNANELNRKEKYTADNRLAAEGDPITDYHGYGAVDYYGVEEHFGTLAQLRELVDAAHAAGFKVIQDQVANHTGPYHPWVLDPPTPTWFNGTLQDHLANTWQTWTLPDPHAPPALRKATLEGWFIDLLPDLNQNDEDCARYLIQNSLWWIGMTGLDAVRQDTLPYVPRAFWSQWTSALRREYPQLNVIGEMFDGDAAKVAFFQGGQPRFDGVDSGIELLFDFPLYYPLRRVFAEGRSIRELPEQLARDQLYVNPSGLVTFLGLHDVSRFLSENGATTAGLKLACTFLLTGRGIPLIYYGDEIALRGGGDPDNRRDFPGGWAGDAPNAFEANGRTAEQREVFDHVARLNRLRKEHAAFRRGQLIHLAIGDQAYAYARVSPAESAVVVLNNSAQSQAISVDLSPLRGSGQQRLEPLLEPGTAVMAEHHRVTFDVPARSGLVYRVAD